MKSEKKKKGLKDCMLPSFFFFGLSRSYLSFSFSFSSLPHSHSLKRLWRAKEGQFGNTTGVEHNSAHVDSQSKYIFVACTPSILFAVMSWIEQRPSPHDFHASNTMPSASWIFAPSRRSFQAMGVFPRRLSDSKLWLRRAPTRLSWPCVAM